MSQYRIPRKNSKYYVEKELYLTTVHFCRQYPTWLAELNIIPDTSKAITYDKEHVKSSNDYDPTSETAMRRAEIERKKNLIDSVADEISQDYKSWLILGICYGLSFFELEERGMLLPRDRYYDMRRRFYYLLSKKI